MQPKQTQVDIVLPGLLDRLQNWRRSYGDLGEYPALQKILGHARRQAIDASGYENTLWSLVAEERYSPKQELAVARTLRGATGAAACCADLVYLRADMADLLLIEGRQLQIAAAEIEAIQALISQHVEAVGGQFSLAANGCGLLQFEDAPLLNSTPISLVAGRGIDRYLPAGDTRGWWHRLMNELQMLLHASDVNQQRELSGQIPINGVWLWGGGRQTANLRSDYSQMYATDSFAQDMAQAAGIPVYADAFSELWSQEKTNPALLVASDLHTAAQYDDVAQWMDHLADLERELFAAILEQLAGRQLSQVTLLPCDGYSYTLTTAALRKFWKRSRPLESWAND